jgi:hypothetical protein
MEANLIKVLAIDIGGTHVKLLATSHTQRVEFPSGPKMTSAKMVAAAEPPRLVGNGRPIR